MPAGTGRWRRKKERKTSLRRKVAEKEEDDDDDENTHTHKHARTDPCRKARARRKLARGEEKVAQETVLPARSAREATQDWKRKREPIYALLTVANNGDDTDDGLRGHGGNNVCVCVRVIGKERKKWNMCDCPLILWWTRKEEFGLLYVPLYL